MGKLKPIGSEKLTGMDKLNRIMEIARYKEVIPTQNKDLQTESYSIQLPDGNTYKIVQERNGYIIKRGLNESLDYMEPMKNRKYHSSFSEAFKRLNLIAKEVSTLHENAEGVSLFGEQKRFTLKTPTPPPPAEPTPEPAQEPSMDMGGDLPAETPAPAEIDALDTPDVGGGEMDDMGGGPVGEVSFKQIQKLTGKLGQKIREFKTSGEMSSKDIKYVVNSILSALDLDKLEEGDREEILARFENDDMDMGDDMGMGDEMSVDTEMDLDLEVPEPEMGEGWDVDEMVGVAYNEPEEDPIDRESKFADEIMDSIFAESKAEKILMKYYTKKDGEKKINEEFKKEKRKVAIEKIKKTMKEVRNLAESVEQTASSLEFMKKNPKYNFIGKTNKSNLVFEYKDNQHKITKEGEIL